MPPPYNSRILTHRLQNKSMWSVAGAAGRGAERAGRGRPGGARDNQLLVNPMTITLDLTCRARQVSVGAETSELGADNLEELADNQGLVKP